MLFVPYCLVFLVLLYPSTTLLFNAKEWWKMGEDRFESLELSEIAEQQWAQAVEFFKVLVAP